jgi:predicted NBD/HSP70 family sugar kinase
MPPQAATIEARRPAGIGEVRRGRSRTSPRLPGRTATPARNPAASRLVRTAGELVGEVLSGSVNFFNPGVIVIGGDLAPAHEQLFAGIRSVVYQRSLPLATRHLQLVPSELGDRAGIFGAARMVTEHALRPSKIEAMVRTVARVRAPFRKPSHRDGFGTERSLPTPIW